MFNSAGNGFIYVHSEGRVHEDFHESVISHDALSYVTSRVCHANAFIGIILDEPAGFQFFKHLKHAWWCDCELLRDPADFRYWLSFFFRDPEGFQIFFDVL